MAAGALAALAGLLTLITVGASPQSTGTDSSTTQAPPPAPVPVVAAGRAIPVGIWGVENNPIRDPDDLFAIRFVLDEPTPIFRFIAGFNLEGVHTDETGAPAPMDIRTVTADKRTTDPRYPAPPADLPEGWTPGSGRIGYANGDGGVIEARLVTVAEDGTPDLANVLAEERVNAVQRYRESKEAFRVDGRTQLLYFAFGGVELEAERPYAVVFGNVAEDPLRDWFSLNSPVTRQSVAGPNGANTLDPNAPGAIAGLDPREAVTWSTDRGAAWTWGWRVGGGEHFGYYQASPTGDDGPRLPWYGWQTAADERPESNQPYYAYGQSGSFTLRAAGVPRATTLTEAGGYAPKGSELGVVTVRNLNTGASGSTPSLGDGLATGDLDRPVEVAAGQAYEISNTGTVAKAEADQFIRATFGVGFGEWPFTTEGQGDDRAELFALPHPWFSG